MILATFCELRCCTSVLDMNGYDGYDFQTKQPCLIPLNFQKGYFSASPGSKSSCQQVRLGEGPRRPIGDFWACHPGVASDARGVGLSRGSYSRRPVE